MEDTKSLGWVLQRTPGTVTAVCTHGIIHRSIENCDGCCAGTDNPLIHRGELPCGHPGPWSMAAAINIRSRTDQALAKWNEQALRLATGGDAWGEIRRLYVSAHGQRLWRIYWILDKCIACSGSIHNKTAASLLLVTDFAVLEAYGGRAVGCYLCPDHAPQDDLPIFEKLLERRLGAPPISDAE